MSLYVGGGRQEAMEQLVVRYAPMVANVCRLTVADPTSAEDTFQATFLILLKSAKKIHRRSSVAASAAGLVYTMFKQLEPLFDIFFEICL